jgi:hypothetical protein
LEGIYSLSHYVLCIGEEEVAPVTGNSHVSVPAPIADNTPNKHDDALENHKPAPPSESHKKEKSVLQAKLTKLAIQIGYAGNFYALKILSGICQAVLLKDIQNLFSV